MQGLPNEDTSKLMEKLRISIPHRLDRLSFSKFHVLVILSLGISWILDGYEVSLLAVLSGVLKLMFTMSSSEIGLAGSVYLFGCVTGSLIFGFLASKWGRKMLFTMTLMIYVLSIIMTASAMNKYMFMAARYCTGISVGGEYSAIFAAIDELIPPSMRGYIDLVIDGTWHFGGIISALIGYFVLTYNANQELSIRLLFIVGAILALPIVLYRRVIPESPRWLVYHGKFREAVLIVEQIEEKCGKSKENLSEEETKNDYDLSSNNIHIQNVTLQEISLKQIFTVFFYLHRRRFLYGLVLMSSQAFFYNGIYYTYTLILQTYYDIPEQSVGLYLIPLSVASFLGPVCIGRFFDSWSRRGMITLTFSLSSILLTLTAMNFYFCILPFMFQESFWFITFFIASPAASSAHLTISEIFPLETRSQAMAIFFSFGLGIGGVFAPFLFGSFVDSNNKMTILISYLVAALVMLFAGIIGFFFGVDAENKSLEELSNYQSVHSQKMTDIAA